MMQDLMKSRIGVWGYGSVGKSFIRFLRAYGYHDTIHLFDNNRAQVDHAAMLREHAIALYPPDQQDAFVQAVDVILPSPGVAVPRDIRHEKRIYTEYNLFRALWPGKIIAITGTIGKTTVTSLIAHLVQQATQPVRIGGNIGIPLLDLLPHATADMIAVIELSSFQLEYGIDYGPDLALITNCYPNHLDRHQSFAAYLAAKMNLVTAQVDGQHAFIPAMLRNHMPLSTDDTRYSWFADHQINAVERARYHTFWWCDGATIVKSTYGADQAVAVVPSRQSFPENWLLAYAVLDHMHYALPPTVADIVLPEHRLAHITTVRRIAFFNDSKATVPQATLAGVKKLIGEYHRVPVLFIGGLSKGVDRKLFVYGLSGLVRHIMIFGAEADQLRQWADEACIPAHAEHTLEAAFYAYTQRIAQQDDIVLFSPSGSSYDLFHDFQERGNCFVGLVRAFANS